MVDRYTASPDEVAKDRKDFYAQGGGKIADPRPGLDTRRLLERWVYLLQEQNGENYDDYAMAKGHKVERYLERWCPPPAKVLFLGTGTGREVYAACVHGYAATGTTLGKENLPFAKWKFGIDLDYVDNCTMSYSDKAFDVVAGFQVFEHCHAPYMFLVECCRVLKEGGLLVLEWPPFMATADGTATPNPGNMHNYMMEYDDDNIHHMCCWTPAQAWIMVRRCGFENVELYLSGYTDGGRSEEKGVPGGLTRITESDEAFWTNVSPGNIVLKAARRSDGKQPRYMKEMLNG
jgi:SAM-dependent methyltransferase